MEALINSAETLAGFADSLVTSGDAGSGADRGWSMPVAGDIIRTFDEADEAGVRRPGWLIGTVAEALVTAPADATVRFADSMPSNGPVIILETSPGRLVILTGQATNFVRRTQIVSEGEPIALMGGREASAQENLIETSLLGGRRIIKKKNIEIRQGQAPVDPAAFLRPSQE
jgi:septal ring factor EnvC (AmiA/AmiB activator)